MNHRTVVGKRCKVVLKNGNIFIDKLIAKTDRYFTFERRGLIRKIVIRSCQSERAA